MSKENVGVVILNTNKEAEGAVNELRRSGFDLKKLAILSRDYLSDENIVGRYDAGDQRVYWQKLGVFRDEFCELPTESIVRCETAIMCDMVVLVIHGAEHELTGARVILENIGHDVREYSSGCGVGARKWAPTALERSAAFSSGRPAALAYEEAKENDQRILIDGVACTLAVRAPSGIRSVFSGAMVL